MNTCELRSELSYPACMIAAIILNMACVTNATAADCNANGTDDSTDIATGTSPDCNENGIPDECEIVASVIMLRSGNGTAGGTDSSVTFLQGPSDTFFSSVLTPGDFAAASAGPPAEILATPEPLWIMALPTDPLAQWISTDPDGDLEGSTALYAVEFDVASVAGPVVLDLYYAVDNVLGTAPNDGVYVNGVAIPGDSSGGGFGQEFSLLDRDITALVNAGTNTLYINATDQGGPSGLIFSATIDVAGDTDCNANGILDECDVSGDATALEWIYNPTTGHSYAMTPIAGSWQQVEDFAVSVGGHLAAINDAGENEWLLEAFGMSDQEVWIGLMQLPGSIEPDGGWVWVNGDPFDYMNWFGGGPNNSGGAEDCAYFLREEAPWVPGEWNDSNCSNSNPGIIERSGRPPSDCNANGIPDDCELDQNDCNSNGLPDECDLTANDCDNNNVPDDCEPDHDEDGLIDECDPDDDNDGVLDVDDVCPRNTPGLAVDCEGRPRADLNDDCLVNGLDMQIFIQVLLSQ